MTTRATRGQTITTLVFAILKIVTGIVVIALYKVVLDKAEDIKSGTEPSFTAFYIFGLPFLVPGVFGLVAAFVKNGVAYGLYMAACIIGCVVDAIFCIFAFAFLFAMASVGGMNCHNVLGKCVCSSGDYDILNSDPVPISGDGCNDLNNIVQMSYGLSAMMIIGWILCLAGSIISCASCCCGQHDPQVVLMHSYPGQVVTVGNHYQPPPYPAMPGAQYAAQGVPVQEPEQDDKNQYKYNRMV